MPVFLVKSDPEEYSAYDLEKDGTTIWDGVHNYAAIGFIKQMRPGDKVYIYHSLKDKAIVAVGTVISEPFENSKDPRYSWAVKIAFANWLNKPVPLASFKNDSSLSQFALVRQSRLSVMPVSEEVDKWITTQSGS